MKVLLISHTVLSKTNNMGKTFLSYLERFSPAEVAQLYIHNEVPVDDTVCTNYYRFTDFDAIQSIIKRQRKGCIFRESDIQKNRQIARVDQGLVSGIYTSGSKRKPVSMAIRELVWNWSAWKSSELKCWIMNVDPDVIFLASGNYAFIYNVAREIADFVNKPLVVSCVDDYYTYNANEESMIGRLVYNFFMKSVCKTMAQTSRIFTICDSMSKQYEQQFAVKCNTLHTGATARDIGILADADQISYIGNLSFNRFKQLIEIAETLRDINSELCIHVYSAERNTEIIDALKEEPNIRFHGAISSDEVLQVMRKSMIVIHTESFDEKIKKLIRYSVSTKIAESLMYGPCLLAYGPEGIASIDYLKQHNAAYVISSKADLEDGLRELLAGDQLRKRILNNARELGRKNHDSAINSANVRKWLTEVCEEHAHESTLY